MSASAIETAVSTRNATSSIAAATASGVVVASTSGGPEAGRHQDERDGGARLDQRIAGRDRLGAAAAPAAQHAATRATGMLSRLRIAVPHFGHAESGVSERPAGTRYTTTFRKEPIASPSRRGEDRAASRVRRSWRRSPPGGLERGRHRRDLRHAVGRRRRASGTSAARCSGSGCRTGSPWCTRCRAVVPTVPRNFCAIAPKTVSVAAGSAAVVLHLERVADRQDRRVDLAVRCPMITPCPGAAACVLAAAEAGDAHRVPDEHRVVADQAEHVGRRGPCRSGRR